jgi:hypothetical protein
MFSTGEHATGQTSIGTFIIPRQAGGRSVMPREASVFLRISTGERARLYCEDEFWRGFLATSRQRESATVA